MKKLIDVLSNLLLEQIVPGKTSIVRLENFDNPLIYSSVCKRIIDSVDFFVAKLTSEKYKEFTETNKPEWAFSLRYLQQGSNESYLEAGNDEYLEKSYVDYNNAITKWRNESSNIEEGKTAIILLMGTEAAADIGGLADTSFVISPLEIIAALQDDYSKWFAPILIRNGIDSIENRRAIHTLFRALFANISINLFSFSAFVDELESLTFSAAQDLVNYICEALDRVWNVPKICDNRQIPKIQALSKGKMSSAAIISNAVRFIERMDDIPTERKLETYKKQFEKYAEREGIDVDKAFPADNPCYQTFLEFRNCVLDFMCGKNIEFNRKRLLSTDYAIIAAILGTKISGPVVSVNKAPVSGEPIEAFSKIFLDAAKQFYEKKKIYPNSYAISVLSVVLSNCVDDQKEDAFRPIASFIGGILGFFDGASIDCNGELVSFAYDMDYDSDPFDFANYEIIKDKIKCTGKWGDPCKITIKVSASNGEVVDEPYEYKWVFSPNSAWPNAFHYLGNVLFRNGGDSYTLPTLVSCENIQDYLGCESEDEFFAQFSQLRDRVLFDEHRKEIHKCYSGTSLSGQFDVVCNDFKNFALKTTQHGMFNALEELRTVVKSYIVLMNLISDDYERLTDVQREKVSLLLNSFTIVSNVNVFSNHDLGEIIVPSYNPVMLEKIDAKQLFIRDGFAELMNRLLASKDASEGGNTVSRYSQLSTITQGLDSVLKRSNEFVTCKNMWDYFGVYYSNQREGELLSGNSYGLSLVTDDEDAQAMLRSTPMSGIIVRNVLDYLHTFPARVDGINIVFVAPTDMQHIVSAIHSIAKRIEELDFAASINVRILCMNSRKNSAAYLRKWLDSYFDEERTVKVNTYLKNIVIKDSSDLESVGTSMNNADICFLYNVLTNTGVQFAQSGDIAFDKDYAKFPMTFTPDTVARAHGKARKINISQFQFLASKAHTQATHKVGYPDSMPGIYRTYETLEMQNDYEQIIETAHEKCKWVVCVDPAIDRDMLEQRKNKIIGFTTGEGSYGELNVTVSARNDILADIKLMLKRRITDRFRNWDSNRLQKAADFCVDVLSQHMDGSRILKALNPYDYEIHNYLANLLSIQMLHLTEKDDESFVRVLISLDSFKHWFEDDKDNMRPDFLLLKIPKSTDNVDPNSKLHILAKVIECKMGFQNNLYVEKAQKQVEKGLKTMVEKWSTKETGVLHRYWLNQLYRSIIFSPLNIDNTAKEYAVIRNKIYGILAGNVEIEWSGDIFAFWLDTNTETPDEYFIESEVVETLSSKGFSVQGIQCHSCGQMFIQKMLLPPDERNNVFEFNGDEQNDEITESVPATEYEVEGNHENIEVYIPKQSEVISRFVLYLDQVQEATRQSSLTWYDECFCVNPEDKNRKYESNGHSVWETVLDTTISRVRHDGIIANSSLGVFSITEYGKEVAQCLRVNPDMDYVGALTAVHERVSLQDEKRDVPANNSEKTDVTQGTQMDEYETCNSRLVKKQLKDVRLLLGEDLRNHEPYYWEFGNKELNNRHLLINGNSGCGKTYCIQTLLMEAALQGVSAVVFDYTGGFANSKLDENFKEKMGDKITQRIVKSKKIPVNPFIKHDIQIDDDLFVPEEDADVADKIAEIFKSVYTLGDQQRSAVYSAVLSGLRKYGDRMSFPAMVEELEAIGSNYARTVISKIQTFIDFNPFTTEESFNWSDIRDSEGTVYIFQLIGYGREIQVLLTELLLWDIWSFSVKNGDESKPFVLVLDEAQNLSHGEKSPSAKILTEGRKFGLSGWYATQFMKPQLSDDEIQRLQQAGQKLYFCPPDDGILTVAKNIDITSQGTKDWSERLKRLKKGECVTCGSMIRNGRWGKYEPRIIKVISFPERLEND